MFNLKLKRVCITLIVCSVTLAHGQVSDSLMRAFLQLPAKDRLNAMQTKAGELMRSDVVGAKQLLEASLPVTDTLKLPIKRIEVLNDLASLELQMDEYTLALKYLQQAEQEAIRQQADTLLTDTYTYLGILFERTQKYEDGLTYLRKAGALQEKLKLGPEASARNLTNIAHVYETQEKFLQAIEVYKAAYTICKNNNIYFGEALISQNLANTHNALARYNESIAYSQQSLEIALANNLPRIVTAAYQNLGASYMGLRQWQEAEKYYEKALAAAEKTNYPKALLDVWFQLSRIYEQKGALDKALGAFKKYTSIKDSVFSAEKQEQIETLQAIYQTEQKEASIKALKQENDLVKVKQQRTYYLIAMLILLFVAGLYIASYNIRQQKIAREQEFKLSLLEKEGVQYKLQQDKIHYELNALKAQMNPHFLFNALNSIQELFLSGNHLQANEYMGKFSDLTRAILDASGQESIVLSQELSILSDYLDLEGLRFNEDFQYIINLHPETDAEQIKIPPMLIQPYVENAVKHGLLHSTGKKVLTIDINQTKPDLLQVKIADNGIGRKKAAYFAALRGKNHKSFATTATEKRLQLLNSGRTENIIVKVSDADEKLEHTGTIVTIEIPIEN